MASFFRRGGDGCARGDAGAYADIDELPADEVETASASQESAAFVTGNGTNKPQGFLDVTKAADASHA